MTEHKRVFATLIARNAKDIDVLIESLPSEDSSAELQVKRDMQRTNLIYGKFVNL